MMGKKENLSYLTDEERDKIMQVLQKDFELRRTEKKLINEAHDELVKEKNRIALLKQKEKFNDSSCIICLERFGVLFHRKRKCHKCELNVCSECSQARDKKKKGFICKVCSKEKAYKMLSNEWFYHNAQATDKNSGSSRIVRWLHKKPAPDPADTDVDSGYNHSSCSSAGPGKTRARLDNVFDIKVKESVDEELPQRSSEATSLSGSEPSEPLSPDQLGHPQPEIHSETTKSDHIAEETVAANSHEQQTSKQTVVPKIVPRTLTSVQSGMKSPSAPTAGPVAQNRNIKETFRALDAEAIDRTKKIEEASFRVEFDKLLRDLYETLNDDHLEGLETNTESPSYEDMMQTFKNNVSDLLKGFTERLRVAYEKCESADMQSNPREQAQEDVCKFTAAFIGQNVSVTSDAALSDFISTVKYSPRDGNSFEDLLAQAVVSKLFDNHFDEVREALWCSDRNSLIGPNRKSSHANEEDYGLSSASDDDVKDTVNFDDRDDVSDINTEIQEMKQFVKNTPQQPRIEMSAFDDSDLREVHEDTVMRSIIDRDKDREEFCARYSVLDRIHNPTLTLPDISYFESGDSVTDETDPDLLSLNLAIIPEETEEETELDTEKKTNWSFKGKRLSTNESLIKTNESLSPGGSFRMRVPIPENVHIPKIGHRNIDQLSDFSDLDGSDDEENTFYANTSTELARIAQQRGKLNSSYQLSDYHSEDSDLSGRFKQHQLLQQPKTDVNDSSARNSEADIESVPQDIKYLENLIPAENDDPTFLVAPEGAILQEGEPVKFSCRVGGTGHIDVFWYREGTEVEELEDSSDVEMSRDGDRHSIVLYNVNKKLGGQYMCIALNEKGKTIKYFVLTVKDNKLEFKKPEFLKGLHDVEVTEGQSVKFRVKVKGYPQPRVNWYKDGKLLRNSRLCRIEKFGNRDYILAIDRVSMDDDAEYTVAARNVAGEATLSAQIIVEPQSDLQVRKQIISSTTTSGVSDSDSDRPLSYQTSILNRNSRNVTPFASAGNARETFTSTSSVILAGRQHMGRETVNPEDERKTFVQKQSAAPDRIRLLTDDVLDDLKIAEDIIQQERYSSASRNQQTFNTSSSFSMDESDSGCPTSSLSTSQKQGQDSQLVDFYLPDSLDDCQLPESPPQDQSTRGGHLHDMQTQVHSITARNVPMEQLESLNASSQNQPSSSSSGKFLDVPVSSPTTSAQREQESPSTPKKSPASSDLKSPLSSTNPPSIKKRHSFQLPTNETFTTLDVRREPVLIYLKTTPENRQQQLEPQTDRVLAGSDQRKPANRRPLTATKGTNPNQLKQSKTTTQTYGQHPGNEATHSSGPRIKGGCISARAAFWERKIAQEEDVSQEEFPDMVEGDT